MNLTRENKLDAWSGLVAMAGIALALAASELAFPLLMAVGVGVVAFTATARVWNFRSKLHERQQYRNQSPAAGTRP